jgi:hypothetical protein
MIGMSDTNCGTGCQDPKHMIECPHCKAKYHYGLIHFCPTSWIPNQPKITFSPPILTLKEEIKMWERASAENLAKTYEKLENKSIHCHLAWFGSELACKECNPVCYKNHQMDNPNHLKWCGEEKCPMNPERFKKPIFPVTYNQELADYLSSPREGPIHCPRCDSANIGLDSDDNHLCNECGYHFDDDELLEPDPSEEQEDNIRKSSRKSIRKGGKYKERGKEKRREP